MNLKQIKLDMCSTELTPAASCWFFIALLHLFFDDLYKNKLTCGSTWMTEISCLSSEPKTSKHRLLGTHISRPLFVVVTANNWCFFFLLDITPDSNYSRNNISTTQQRFVQMCCCPLTVQPPGCCTDADQHCLLRLSFVSVSTLFSIHDDHISCKIHSEQCVSKLLADLPVPMNTDDRRCTVHTKKYIYLIRFYKLAYGRKWSIR